LIIITTFKMIAFFFTFSYNSFIGCLSIFHTCFHDCRVKYFPKVMMGDFFCFAPFSFPPHSYHCHSMNELNELNCNEWLNWMNYKLWSNWRTHP
jgi:hypothetical protein